jgi:hypothetical protein
VLPDLRSVCTETKLTLIVACACDGCWITRISDQYVALASPSRGCPDPRPLRFWRCALAGPGASGQRPVRRGGCGPRPASTAARAPVLQVRVMFGLPPPPQTYYLCPVTMCTLMFTACAASLVCQCRYPDFLKDVGSTERLRARFAVLLSLNERLRPLLSLVDVTVRRQSLVGPCHAGTNQAAPKLRV